MDPLARIRELAARLGDTENPITSDELSELESLVDELSAELLSDPEADIAVLEELVQVAEQVAAHKAEQAAAAAAAAAQREELAARFAATRTPEEGDDTGDDDGGEGDGDGGGDETASAPGEPAADTALPTAPAPAPAAAAAARQPIVTASARRPARTRPQAAPSREMALTASAQFNEIRAGQTLDGSTLGRALAEAFTLNKHLSSFKVSVGRMATIAGDDRLLGGDEFRNREVIERVTGPAALTAAGGICAPAQTRYDLPVVGDQNARPIRDSAMAQFRVETGGGIRTLPVPTLDDAAGSFTRWTAATDANPGSQLKACLQVGCDTPADESIVDALVSCLEFSNFRERFFTEQIDAYKALAATYHARRAEQILLADIDAGSNALVSGTVLGVSRDIFVTLDRRIMGLESFHRLPDGQRYRAIIPRYVKRMIRSDFVRQMPFGTADELFALADAQMERWFEARGINVTWSPDAETIGAQGDGAVNGFPSRVKIRLYPEGSWLHGDGGVLDLGIVRDSTLNAKNSFRLFIETFEFAHFHGVESDVIDMDVCVDGSASALVDINPCAVNS